MPAEERDVITMHFLAPDAIFTGNMQLYESLGAILLKFQNPRGLAKFEFSIGCMIYTKVH